MHEQTRINVDAALEDVTPDWLSPAAHEKHGKDFQALINVLVKCVKDKILLSDVAVRVMARQATVYNIAVGPNVPTKEGYIEAAQASINKMVKGLTKPTSDPQAALGSMGQGVEDIEDKQ